MEVNNLVPEIRRGKVSDRASGGIIYALNTDEN